ncbi:MAG: carbohydrate-binding domain-containing protein, partial [Clostridia bacterium]|nr:carbohydrate-binding domain-containing protein [Clostridia bacterium]
PLLDESGFKLQNYDGEKEWCYYYTDGKHDEYIFATLPSLGNKLPTDMMYSADEASKNKVLHITKAGTYSLQGEWNGQILVDLGDEDENFTDKNSKVTLILNGADITCTVAPAIVFRDTFECDNAWEDRDEHSVNIDTADAGVNVVLADGTKNNVDGKNIYRMLKTVYKDDDSDDQIKVQKKLRKIDAAFYSYQSMNIDGKGALNVTSSFEGLDSELHLSINSGDITINSQDDGINVNEDNVSVIAINGGNITLNAALGAEGDGIDSNGFVAINGGTLNINGITAPDSAIDSENGITYNAGDVFIDGKEQSYTAGSTFNETGGMGGGKNFGERPDMPNAENFDLKEFKQKVADLPDDATREDVMALLGMDNFRGERP